MCADAGKLLRTKSSTLTARGLQYTESRWPLSLEIQVSASSGVSALSIKSSARRQYEYLQIFV